MKKRIDALPLDVTMKLAEMVTTEELATISAWDAFDAWLRWNGIIGFTGSIVRIYGECKKLNQGRSNQEDLP